MRHDHYIWFVEFDTSYGGYNGDLSHTQCEQNRKGHVITRKDDLRSVEQAIESGLGQQLHVSKLRRATFLGKCLNDPQFIGDGS